MFYFFFFKQKTAYEMRISDWSSDVCSSDLGVGTGREDARCPAPQPGTPRPPRPHARDRHCRHADHAATAAAEIGNQVERHHRRAIGGADQIERKSVV